MTSARVENLELDTGQRDWSVNVAPTTAIERPKTAAHAPRERKKDYRVMENSLRDAWRTLEYAELLTAVVGNGPTGVQLGNPGQ